MRNRPNGILKLDNLLNVNPNVFREVSTPEASYILGFLWADGYIIESRHRIGADILSSDAREISKYKIRRTIVVKTSHSYSTIRMCSNEAIFKFAQYIYRGQQFGLSRKLIKLQAIIDQYTQARLALAQNISQPVIV